MTFSPSGHQHTGFARYATFSADVGVHTMGYGNPLDDHEIEQPWRCMEAFAQACSVPRSKFVSWEPASTCFKSTWILRFELYL